MSINPPLKAVHVTTNSDGEEYYEIGKGDTTAIEWGMTNGSMAHIDTIQVFKNGELHSEHPFINVLGVYYAKAEASK